MKFLHISDLHLGKRVNEFSMIEDQKFVLQQILAAAKDRQADGVFIAGDEISSEHLVLTNLANGDTAAYRYLDFDGETVFSIRMKSNADCRVELYVDGMYHADFKVAAAETYADTRAAIPALLGAHTLTLKFFGEFTDGAMESFTFTIDDCSAQ